MENPLICKFCKKGILKPLAKNDLYPNLLIVKCLKCGRTYEMHSDTGEQVRGP